MRGASRFRLVAALGLAAVCLVGTGCQTTAPGRDGPAFGSGPQPGLSGSAAPQPLTSRPAPESADDTARQIADLGAAAPTTASEPRPVVWRASSRGYDPEERKTVRTVAWKGLHRPPVSPVPNDLPKELDKVTMPPYRIEPPDVLLIDCHRIVPRPPYRIEPLDELLIQANPKDVPLSEPINGTFTVSPDGRVDLLHSYGKFTVAGLTVDEAAEKLRREISTRMGIKEPKLVVSLARMRNYQAVRGSHAVRADGTVSLGTYGNVRVVGLTLAEAREAIVQQLSQKLQHPEVTVDIAASYSKVYYVIFDAGKQGQQVVRLPFIGGETVLDALAQVPCLPAGGCGKRIWVARPVPGCVGYRQVLPVDWEAITAGAATTTNYQLFPGDRIYVKTENGFAFSHAMNKVFSPFERLFSLGGR